MDVFDIKDARLLAEVRTKQWMAEFEAEYQRPVIEMAKAQFWNGLPPEVKANLAQRVPKAVMNMEKIYGGKNGRQEG